LPVSGRGEIRQTGPADLILSDIRTDVPVEMIGMAAGSPTGGQVCPHSEGPTGHLPPFSVRDAD
jgi:hypothetical protein